MSTPTTPQGHPDEVPLDSPDDLRALAAETAPETGTEDDDEAPWADGVAHAGGGDLPEPQEDAGSDEADDADDAAVPRSVEGVGDLVADPLSRAGVVHRDDPGGPTDEEVPPSPS